MFLVRSGFVLGMMLCLISVNVMAQSEEDVRQKLEEAQSLDWEVRIEVEGDDNVYIGKVESITATEVDIVTASTKITFTIKNIKRVIIIDPNNKASRWYENKSRNRLFLSQTARNNEANSGYYQNIYIFFSTLSYSPTNFLTVNAGFSNIPELTLDGDFFYLGAKISAKASENFALGISGTLFSAGGESLGFVNFLGTYSNNRFDLTTGLGYGVEGGSTSSPLLMFGFQYRVNERWSLVSENFTVPSIEGSLISLGPRFLGRKITTDLGFFFVPESIEGALPYASFTVAF